VYLTTAEYLAITGETAPSDFAPCLKLAESQVDAHTMMFYAQATLADLPAFVTDWLKSVTAYQVQAISHGGGVSGATENDHTSVTLGKYSYSKGVPTSDMLCLPAASLMPYLVAYARGVKACNPYLTNC
jgi:hypothetical protein